MYLLGNSHIVSSLGTRHSSGCSFVTCLLLSTAMWADWQVDPQHIILPRKDLLEQAQPVSGSTPEPNPHSVPRSLVHCRGPGRSLITSTTSRYRLHVSSQLPAMTEAVRPPRVCRDYRSPSARRTGSTGSRLMWALGAKQNHRLFWGAASTLAATSRQQRRFQGDKRGGHDPCNRLVGEERERRGTRETSVQNRP